MFTLTLLKSLVGKLPRFLLLYSLFILLANHQSFALRLSTFDVLLGKARSFSSK